jgi:hypothetical protein
MSIVGSHDPFGHSKHKLWPKEGSRVKLAIWLSTTKSLESPRFPCVWHIVEKFSMKVIALLQTIFQSVVCWQNYGPPKSQESQLWEFQDSHLRVQGQNAIWVLVPRPGTEYTIRGKVVASPKSISWSVLWIWVCPWLVLTPKVLELCTNQLVVWFCAGLKVIDCLSFFLVQSRNSNMPLYPQSGLS